MPYSWDDDNDFSTSAGSGFSFHKARRSYDDVAIAKKKRTAWHWKVKAFSDIWKESRHVRSFMCPGGW